MRDNRPHRRFVGVRAVLAVALAVLPLVAIAPVALGHAILIRSDPGDGTVVARPPTQILLWFSEAVDPDLSAVELLDGRGERVDGTRRLDPGRRDLLALTLPALPPDVYSVDWNVFSEGDAHYAGGHVVFRVGAGAAPTRTGPSGPEGAVSPLEAALRWLDLTALLTLAGALAVAGWVLNSAAVARDRSERTSIGRARLRAFGLGAIAAGLATVLGLVLLGRQVALAHPTGGGGLGSVRAVLLGTEWGTLWMFRQGHLVVLGALLLLASRGESAVRETGGGGGGTPLLLAAAFLLVSLARVHVLAGHASSAEGSLAAVAGTAHLLAAGAWVGGLLALLIVWPGRGAGPARTPSLMRQCLRRFGALAVWSVVVIAATGLYQAGQEVDSLDALLTTIYGRTLLGKTVLFLAVGALGLANALALHPRAAALLARRLGRPPGWTPVSPRRAGRLVLVEACLGLLVIGAAGVLGAAPPAKGPVFEPALEPTPSTRTAAVGDLLVSVSVKPNRPGPNAFEVLAASTTRPPLAEIQQVILRITDEDGRTRTTPPLRQVEPGRFRVSGDFLDAGGSWRIDAVIERSGLPESVGTFGWVLGAEGGGHSAVVSDAPLEPILTRAAAALLASALLAGIGWFALRRRPGAFGQPRAPDLRGDLRGLDGGSLGGEMP